MFILTFADADETRRVPLKEGNSVIGRAAGCDVLVNDSSVSRRHARLSVAEGACSVTDLGSRNGTYVNGVAIEATTLNDGDRIDFGCLLARLEVSAEDQLALTDGPVALPPVLIDRPVDEARSRPPVIEPDRLLRLLSEIVRSLAKQQPLGDVLDEVVRLTLWATDAERAFLVLRDARTGALVPRVARRRDNRQVANERISRTIVNRVMTDRVALLASNVSDDSQFDGIQSILANKIGAFMCAPLWNQETAIGALYVDTHLSGFSDADLELLTALAHCAAIAIEQARLASTLNEETRRRERLGRYHSPAVVARILNESGDEMSFLAQERDITVLFADIVGFTTMAEGMPAPEVATILNRFFTRMSEIVFQYEGTLDKFIGDALLAVFGAPLDQPDHAVRGVNAARAMRRALRQVNTELSGPPLQVRMALNSGLALAGDIGAPARRDYTVLGDVVNTASRLESTIARPGQIVITRATYDRLEALEARSLGPVTLRGRKERVEVFEVLDEP